jgi:hypothetical protein
VLRSISARRLLGNATAISLATDSMVSCRSSPRSRLAFALHATDTEVASSVSVAIGHQMPPCMGSEKEHLIEIAPTWFDYIRAPQSSEAVMPPSVHVHSIF